MDCMLQFSHVKELFCITFLSIKTNLAKIYQLIILNIHYSWIALNGLQSSYNGLTCNDQQQREHREEAEYNTKSGDLIKKINYQTPRYRLDILCEINNFFFILLCPGRPSAEHYPSWESTLLGGCQSVWESTKKSSHWSTACNPQVTVNKRKKHCSV